MAAVCLDILRPRSGEALLLRQIAFVFTKAFVLAAAVASLVGCSSPHYRTAPIARTGTVRMSTLRLMESYEASINIELVGANRAAPFIHLVPVFGSVPAIALLGERLQFFHAVGYLLVLAGITLPTRR